MGHMGLSGKREGQPKVGRVPPHPLVRIGLGEGGGAPFPSPSPLPFPLLVGVLLLLGGGLLLGVPIGLASLLPLLLYIRGQGAPLETQVDPRDHILSCVRCPLPP